jgi:hypothetical protein
MRRARHATPLTVVQPDPPPALGHAIHRGEGGPAKTGARNFWNRTSPGRSPAAPKPGRILSDTDAGPLRSNCLKEATGYRSRLR